MPELADPVESRYWSTVAQLKAAIDPYGILSPGRYAPEETRAAATAF